MLNVQKCEHYDNFFGTCNLYSYERCGVDDIEEVPCNCRSVYDCEFKIENRT